MNCAFCIGVTLVVVGVTTFSYLCRFDTRLASRITCIETGVKNKQDSFRRCAKAFVRVVVNGPLNSRFKLQIKVTSTYGGLNPTVVSAYALGVLVVQSAEYWKSYAQGPDAAAQVSALVQA